VELKAVSIFSGFTVKLNADSLIEYPLCFTMPKSELIACRLNCRHSRTR